MFRLFIGGREFAGCSRSHRENSADSSDGRAASDVWLDVLLAARAPLASNSFVTASHVTQPKATMPTVKRPYEIFQSRPCVIILHSDILRCSR